MLSTGIFDNLAHIIKEFYKLEVKNVQGVTLKLPEKKNTSPFFQEMQRADCDIFNLLSSPTTQAEIKMFYPLRDALQHREIFRGILYSGPTIDSKNLIELSDEVFYRLKHYSDDISVMFFHDRYLNSYLFIIWAQRVLIEIVNGVLSTIKWDLIVRTLPPNVQDKIRESQFRFEQGVGTFLRFPEEPWYF